MTTCPSSIRKSPPSCSGDPYKSWPASRLKLGQRVETSSSSSSERGSRTSTSERSFTSCCSEFVILSAKQKPTILFYEVAGCATGSIRPKAPNYLGRTIGLYLVPDVSYFAITPQRRARRISQITYLLPARIV